MTDTSSPVTVLTVLDEDRVYATIQDDTTISDASKTQYLSKLQFLVNATGRGLYWVLTNPQQCIEEVREFRKHQKRRETRVAKSGEPVEFIPPQTVRAYCCSVSAVFNRMSRDQRRLVGADAMRAWRAMMEESSASIQRKYNNRDASDFQRDNYVSWEKLQERRDELGADPRTDCSRIHLVLSFLTLLPPMRTSDLGSLRLLRRCDVEAGRYSRDELKECNYVVIGDYEDDVAITVNEYKTARHYQRIEEDIREKRSQRKQKMREFYLEDEDEEKVRLAKEEDERDKHVQLRLPEDMSASRTGRVPFALARIVQRSAKIDPREWVFCNTSKKPYVLNSFNKGVLRDLSGAFGGKRVTVNLIRHAAAIWLEANHKYDHSMLRYFRKWMMHSQSKQAEYVLVNNMRPSSPSPVAEEDEEDPDASLPLPPTDEKYDDKELDEMLAKIEDDLTTPELGIGRTAADFFMRPPPPPSSRACA